ncbi:integrase [Arthrobacter sp. V4I6]|uniref:tyrosine-type recombinase/integrase n=1 Tax=Arthrobacter sp. V4I6 TaxID=3042281 RepID=UPI00278A83AB|nr:site-specific integrase [Arthrobacter sp. V4I6]MDQ0854841.1 integrase [Arthrobacter sp. V4I6]
MARVEDRWTRKDRTRTPEYGTGKRWRAVWTEGGDERKKSFDVKDTAKAHLAWVEHNQRSGTYVSQDRGRVFVRDLLEEWVDALAHLKPSTLAATKSDVRATIRPYWGDRILADIRRADVQAWVSGMGKAARTVDTIYGRFRSFLNWCVEEGRITATPAKGVNLPQGVKREHIYLTIAEVERLAGAIAPHYQDLVWFLATTGLRFGEAAELRTKDIHLRRQRLRVARSITDVGGRMLIGPPKGGKERDVPITAFIAERLAARLQGKGRDDLIFPTLRGKAMRSNNFKRRDYDPAVTAAGLPAELWVHDLRHTAASLAIHSGASVKSVQRMLGHASAKITLDVYAGLFDQELSDVAARMDALIQTHTNLNLPEISLALVKPA